MKKNYQLTNFNILKLKTKSSLLLLLTSVLPLAQAQTFSYTGAVQSITLSPGSYQVELWGANGGDALKGTGGKGGYTSGTLNVTMPMTYYIYVGGKGSTATASTPGGWNGGGSCLGTYSGSNNGGTGGGGTDIRTTENTTYANRIIVAGGGGGGNGYSTYTGNGGDGGGLTGSNGASSRGANYAGGGGSQTAGGSPATGGIIANSTAGTLGVGGNYSGTATLGGTAGGGGYYGGGSGHWGGAGGGGSSYIGLEITGGATIQYNQTGFVANPDVTGNGMLRFTNTLSTNEITKKTSISIYPNPTIDVINITNVSDKAAYKIYTTTGTIVSTGTIKNNKIDVSLLEKGVYIISISDGNKEVLNKKFIKN